MEAKTLDTQKRRIDRNSALPLYKQLANIVVTQIEHELEPNDRLPSEAQLCEAYGVSRSVVRQALSVLAIKGLVHKVKGRGVFVTGRKIDAGFVQQSVGFYEEMTSKGHEVETRVLEQRVESASIRVAERLRLGVDEQIVYLSRVRAVDGETMLVVRSYLPYRMFPGLELTDFSGVSLYALLKSDYGIRVGGGERTIEAIALAEEDASHLGVLPGIPALLVESVTYTQQGNPTGEPFEYFIGVYRGDLTKFAVKLDVQGGSKAHISPT